MDPLILLCIGKSSMRGCPTTPPADEHPCPAAQRDMDVSICLRICIYISGDPATVRLGLLVLPSPL